MSLYGGKFDEVQNTHNRGRKVTCPGEKHWNTILTEKQIIEISKIKDKTQKQIAKIYNVSSGTIGHIRRGERWKHIFENTDKYGVNLSYIKEGKTKGEKHYMSKLTNDDVIKIRSKKDISGREMAKIYGVAFQTISCIRRNKTWKHVLME
ncbi:MAG: hypothetical protein WC998_04860 [Candidatus Paceibacterota bacterium]|jgi:hypothetical protein